jgi:hypothetical protein
MLEPETTKHGQGGGGKRHSMWLPPIILAFLAFPCSVAATWQQQQQLSVLPSRRTGSLLIHQRHTIRSDPPLVGAVVIPARGGIAD